MDNSFDHTGANGAGRFVTGRRHIDMLRADAYASHMLAYVKKMLESNDSSSKSGVIFPFRSRFSHIERVIEWAMRIWEAEGGDAGVIAAAAIFHDSGYYITGAGHAARSAQVFRDYMASYKPEAFERASAADAANAIRVANVDKTDSVCTHTDISVDIYTPDETTADIYTPVNIAAAVRAACSSDESINTICAVIASHSDKHLPADENMQEANILMDADVLDEIGAMSVLWDCFSEASTPAYDYISAYKRILARYKFDEQEIARFRTREGKKRFLEMRRYVGAFLDGLKTELNC